MCHSLLFAMYTHFTCPFFHIKTVNVGLYYSVNDGEPAELSGKKCTLDADHTSYTFEDLLTTDDDNNPITYIVREESVTLADNTVVSPEEAGINVVGTELSMYEACGILYNEGLSGIDVGSNPALRI